jgi:hypothetical protein
VVLDSVRADEQPGADLGVGQAVTGQPRDLGFLSGKLLAGRVGSLGYALVGGFPGSHQLAAGPFGEGFHADGGQQVAGGAELFASVGAAVLAAQPLAVQQVSPSQFRAEPGPAEPVDRLPVQALRGPAIAYQGAAACLDAQSPVGSTGLSGFREPAHGLGRQLPVPGTGGGLD